MSPVRHLREGVIAAHAHSLTHSQSQDGRVVQYFPSYEIMLDELRDYGYYKEDFVHPSALAEKIIFRRFIDTFVVQADTKLLCEKIDRVQRGVDHRPLMETTQAYKSHLLLLLKQMNEISVLSEKASASKNKIDFTTEKDHIVKCLQQHFDFNVDTC